MEKPVCYAIMPYGGENQAMRNHFAEVFQLYIETPARNCGYRVIREDYEGQGGPIPTNIIKHIAEADLVIADVSTVGEQKQPNFNVAYELGIRHAMVKHGTILIRNINDAESAFDVRQLMTIKYGNTLVATQQEIQQAIETLKKRPDADNEVHTAYPNFSDRMVDYLAGGDTRMMEIQQENSRLQQENSRLLGLVKKHGLDEKSTVKEKMDIKKSIADALKSIQYSGRNLLVSLQRELERDKPDYHKIAEELEMGLTIGQLSEGNFRRLYQMFKLSEIPQLTGVILEVAAERYPKSLDFKSYLADLYSDTYETWDKAQRYANEVLEVSQDDDGNYCTSCMKIDADQLAACFNAYIGMERYDITVQIGPILLEQVPEHRELILRNLSVSYRQLRQPDKESEILRKLIEEYPMSDVNHYRLGMFYRRRNNDVQAYYQYELTSALDPEDLDYLFLLAGAIIDERMAYVDGALRTNLNREISVNLAVPFLYQAMKVQSGQSTYQRCQEFLLRNRLMRQLSELEDWIRSDTYPDTLIWDAVDHVVELSKHLDEDFCKRIEL